MVIRIEMKVIIHRAMLIARMKKRAAGKTRFNLTHC